jgi:hypothetical protein
LRLGNKIILSPESADSKYLEQFQKYAAAEIALGQNTKGQQNHYSDS